MWTDLQIAYQCAPVVVQKVNDANPRGDFITRIDFTDPGNLRSLTRNWGAVNDPIRDKRTLNAIRKGKESLSFSHKLLPHIYYSVVETHSHYFIMYAIYHPQDWESHDTALHFGGPKWWTSMTEHEHDMEGALIVAGKRDRLEDLRADAMITISHWWFYSFANWKLTNDGGNELDLSDTAAGRRYQGSRVNRENLDGNLWAIWHIDEEGAETIRPKVYVQGKGHGIRGDKGDWSGGDRIIRYCPSLKEADEPTYEENKAPNAHTRLEHRNSLGDSSGKSEPEVYRYKLINIFEPNAGGSDSRGLWESRDDRAVFMLDGKGQDCYVAHDLKTGELKPGAAKPPWSWDDCDDAHTSGELALQPAHIVYGYIGGFREFSLQYVRNQYVRI